MQSKFMLAFFLLVSLPLHAHGACVTGDGSGFVLRGGEATDPKHGLTWKRCAVGMRWDRENKRCAGNVLGLGLNEALDHARKEGNGWRVPTGMELETLLLETCEGPKIDGVAFPDIAASDFGEGAKFWTSTEAIPDMFYFFELTNGYADMHSRGYHLSVLLVR